MLVVGTQAITGIFGYEAILAVATRSILSGLIMTAADPTRWNRRLMPHFDDNDSLSLIHPHGCC
jgi:hypothetical protein